MDDSVEATHDVIEWQWAGSKPMVMQSCVTGFLESRIQHLAEFSYIVGGQQSHNPNPNQTYRDIPLRRGISVAQCCPYHPAQEAFP